MKNRKLTPSAEHALKNLSNNERALYVLKEKWIPYMEGTDILEELQFILNHPRGDRPSGMAIIGDSNNGKTKILKSFINSNQTIRFEDRANVRILDIEAPPVPSLPQLYAKILNRIGDPRAEKGVASMRLERLIILLTRLEVECLVVDEIHNVLAGSPVQQRAFLNMLKHISNELKSPVIIAGTNKVDTVVGTDYQVQSRYPIYRLPLWEPNKEMGEFLVRLEATLPLRNESRIWEWTGELYQLSGGVIGNIVGIVRRAAYEAIKSGSDKITLKSLKHSARKVKKPGGLDN